MTDETKCPNCGKEVDTGNKFQDHYDDGAEEWVECKGCSTIFKLTQHYAPYYVVNECGSESHECANVECEKNSMKAYADIYAKFEKRERAPYCISPSDVFPCRKYKPTDEMIRAYEKETGEKYARPDE